jgi:hypothetical protein
MYTFNKKINNNKLENSISTANLLNSPSKKEVYSSAEEKYRKK